ncbi:substrate-binding and VWA domain-containing protein [Mycobacterium sp. PSTR-4-N]|uniref:substrate-binding and VWA domain-containing protein n=1 Tax=Mycobacterium sp. PSTR-4-N TaxID=2917745 RepID=UPI001F156BE4|nr:substrate-binding and VWA domain-containing protein [Mycobacterium sp. PSTR-4-N]MCG7596655.1 substrate-binding and VWA domain-containing protein [Mycobacterium sp. PSTR-4-N]
MGRHSLPDPDDSDSTRRQGPAPDESQTERFGAARKADGSRPDGQRSGGWDNGEWTGSHRAVTPGRRKISVGVIVALISVVVIVGAVIMWRFFGDALSSRSQTAAARCVEGEVAVAVVADPAIAEPVTALAQRYNDTAEPVGDKCVKVEVTSADSDQVFNGLTGDWPGDLGQRPALWIPASSASEARLEAKTGPRTVSDSRSLVTSPVVLATSPQVQGALKDQNWGTLARLQSDPAGLDGLGLQGWGGLRLALPVNQDSDASYLAAEAIAAASAPAGSPPSAGLGAVSTVMAAAPDLDDATAGTAFDALLGADDPATAPVHAVVTTEQRLFQKAADLPDANAKLAAWLPPGPTAVADFPTVLLSGDGLAQEQISAASEFARFMRKPDQLAELAKAGFRVEGQQPPASYVVSFRPLGTPVDLGDNALRVTIADMLASPAQSPTVTVMLDQSMPTDEGGKSRLSNVVDALTARLQVLPPDSGVGLWTFDGVAGRSEVPLGALSDQVNGQPRSAAVTAALDGQSPSDGGAVSFTTLRLVYTDASAKYREGQKNSVLVITAGPHTDQSLGADGLQQYVSGAFDPAKPVAINVIDFGDDPDRSTWEAVSRTTGGTYQNLSSSSGPELASAVATMMG